MTTTFPTDDLDTFIAGIRAVDAGGWSSVAAIEPGPDWDGAWETALAAGGYFAAQRAMESARLAGAGLHARAIVGAAAGAIAVRDRVAPAVVETLLAPLGVATVGVDAPAPASAAGANDRGRPTWWGWLAHA